MSAAAGYRGYSAQISSPICVGQPTKEIRKFWDEVALSGFEKMVAEVGPGQPADNIRLAGQFFREKGVQSRPIHVQGIDLITGDPHVFTYHVGAEPFAQVLKPGMVLVVEPNPITTDGMLGMFFGHTFIITATGRECVTPFPWKLAIAGK